MEIRKACKKDIPEIITLLNQVELVHYQIRPDLFKNGGSKYDEETLDDLLITPNIVIYVALEEEKVIGHLFAEVEVTKDDPVMQDHISVYIDDLCVDKNHQRKKVATQLFEKLKQFALSFGCEFITLNVWENNDAAKTLYEHLGFIPRKTVLELRLEQKDE